MTAPEFRAALAALNLSQVGAAKLFGVNDRTARRWASGDQEVPRVVALCLRLMVNYRVPVAAAEALASTE